MPVEYSLGLSKSGLKNKTSENGIGKSVNYV